MGPDTRVVGPLNMRPDSAHKIGIGSNCFLNSEIRFGCEDVGISIGDNALIGPRVQFETGTHSLHLDPQGGWGRETRGITVGTNCWIGAGAIILGGVVIGDGAVVAAGAVVNKDVAPNTVVGGVPARLLRSL